MSGPLRIYEIGPRDGLMQERTPTSAADKLALIDKLAKAGLTHLEATGFVSAMAAPQLADSRLVLPGAMRHRGLEISAYVVDEHGYEAARQMGATRVAFEALLTPDLALTRAHDHRVETIATLVSRARTDGVWCRVYLGPAWVCPLMGPVAADRVWAAASRLSQADELSLVDTIGHAHPREVAALIEQVASTRPLSTIAVLLRDTQALGLANASAAIEAGVRTIDASIGGLGTSKWAAGSALNLATEDVALLAQKLGFETGLDLHRLHRAAGLASTLLQRPVGGRTAAWWADRLRTPYLRSDQRR